ncbi:MAG: 4-alpha-glucanotransferase [Alphaproteobacteria bacterium]
MNNLYSLAEKAGIITSFEDRKTGEVFETSEATIKAILKAMGFAADSDSEVKASLKKIEEKDWFKISSPVLVKRIEDEKLSKLELDVVLPKMAGKQNLAYKFRYEDGKEVCGNVAFSDMKKLEDKEIDGFSFEKRSVSLTLDIPQGYHDIEFTLGGGAFGSSNTRVIVAPKECFMPEGIKENKVWGFPLQLYALRSNRNYGVGDFSDLIDIINLSADLGADVVGLNPLNLLFHTNPKSASPYYSCSRKYLSPIYIDIEKAPYFYECPEAQAIVNSNEYKEKLWQARTSDTVNYSVVYSLKMPVFVALHKCFKERHNIVLCNSELASSYRKFCQEGGKDLQDLAVYQVLDEIFLAKGVGGGWYTWPEEYRNPNSEEVKIIAGQYADRVDFFKYLQWEADRQLTFAGLECLRRHLKVGLYQDLAVGVAEQSAETWSHQELFPKDIVIGAPPDRFNPNGQVWGLAPMSPIELKNEAYEPFIKIIQANMQQAGAVRIDHVMGLLRLYWIPKGLSGSYVQYPFDDIAAIIALESNRHKCLVVGEDLGTVPHGFKDKMHSFSILSLRMFRGMRDYDGKFKSPYEYEEMAVAGIGTHDMATLPALWSREDIELYDKYNFYPTPQHKEDTYKDREEELQLILDALIREKLLSNKEDKEKLISREITKDVMEAIHYYLARSNCLMFLVQLEDWLGQKEQMNLPGTYLEYPNWRHKMRRSVQSLFEDSHLRDFAKKLCEERKGKK